ncbi:MAG TPA: ABC transporter permease [Vicinamibacteria bacterium]|jgi:putative ABC transport system permease protein
MKFLPLIFANLLRKKVRTALTIGSFAVALFLFGLLATIRVAFSQGIDVAGADRLMVINKVSIIQPLPLPYRDRILRIPGVKQVTFANWFGGVYIDEKNFFPQFAVDAETYRSMYPEFVIPEDQWKAFQEDKAGAIAGKLTADKYHWKIGDRIPIKGTYLSGVFEFNLHGIYQGTRPQDDTTQFWFHWDYLNEKMPASYKNMIGWYTLRIENPDQAAHVMKTIDETFANSPYETRAQTEKEMATSFAKQMGNIEFLILSIGAVVFFTLLLVTGNTMAIAVRERTGELAVLKTVGFADGAVLMLVLAESVLVALLGGGLGIALAKALTLRGDPTNGFLPIFYLPPQAVAAGVGVALLVGVIAGFLPAFSAMRLRVVEALRRV